jgi:hypothetical protein
MKEDCALKIEGSGNAIILSTDTGDSSIFHGKIGKPKVAICPFCGEVSFYTDELKKL